MSFTTEVKKEISFNVLMDCCKKAELSALVQLCSTLSFSSQGIKIVVKTENATIAKRIWTMIKEEFKVECQLSVIKKMKLKKNNIYQITILERSMDILEELSIITNKGLQERPAYRLVQKECCARAYLAGAFMATGSVNAPTKTNYHLEIATNNEEHAQFIQKLMNRFNLPAKTIIRRKQIIVYLKAAEKIADFLRCIGTVDSLFKFEDIRITRDFRNNLTRLDNCEVANEMKSQEAGLKQINDINVLKEANFYNSLDAKLKEVAEIRISMPEASLLELCVQYEKIYNSTISKSGMKHRLKKIQEKALLVTNKK